MRQVKRDCPVYIMTGFLESGKTTFINDTVHQDYFAIKESTLIVNCESGVEEYDPEELKKDNILYYEVENQEDFTEELFQKLEDELKPGRVIFEFNPLWSMKKFSEMNMPEGWNVIQIIVIVDASTYDIYRMNMRSLFGEMAQNADLVLFNRCRQDMDLANYRRGIKAANPACDVAFEGEDGEMIDLFEDSVPYDLDTDPIVIDDMDYGIFYVDLRDNPDRYRGRRVHFRGKIMKSKHLGVQEFVVGRMAMTCCAADTSFIGYVCIGDQAKEYSTGDYCEITAKVDWKFRKEYRGKGPVFKVESLTPSPAIENDMVYFN